jgi:3-oxoacyl-[acyl-carrier protein] reductase
MMQDKVVIVTGAAKGIGRHAARTCAEAGAKVVLADFDNARLQQTAAELAKITETLALSLDVREEDDVTKMVGAVLDKFGRIDVLVNNAAIVPHFAWGIPRWPRISEMPKDFWDRVIQTNLNGSFLCARAVIPAMEKRKAGHIINLYGGGGIRPPGACAYIVTKDALRTFTRYLAEEVRESNICVTIFSPRVPIATEGAPDDALKRLPGPEVLGQAFVLAAELPLEKSGRCFAYENGTLVDEGPRD